LLQFSTLAAPFIPFLAEELYQNLRDGHHEMPLSVHLCDLPNAIAACRNEDLEKQMELIRTVINLGRSLRQKHAVKTRQVLPAMLVITRKTSDQQTIERYYDLIAQELNVKEVQFSSDEASHVRLTLQANLPTLGKRLGKELGQVRGHLLQLSNSQEQVSALLAQLEEHGTVEVLGHQLSPEDFLINRGPRDERLIASEHGVTILLDTTLTEALKAEGFARELVNRIQNLRKDSGLQVSDRIHLHLIIPPQMAAAVSQFQRYIQAETLASTLSSSVGGGDCPYKFTQSYLIDEMACIIALEKDPQ
jgi:isoleucyl-tRNA synthetase